MIIVTDVPQTLTRDDLIDMVMRSEFALPHKMLVRTLLYQIGDAEINAMIDLCLKIAKLIAAGQGDEARASLTKAGLPDALSLFIVNKAHEVMESDRE